MNLKKTRIEGMKIFKVPTEILHDKSEKTKRIVKQALIEKPLKIWEKELKQNKSNLLLANKEGDFFQATTFTNKKIVFAGIAPNLIQAYFDLAYQQVQITEKYAETFHYIASDKFERIKLIDTPIFNRFIQYRISAIIFIHLSVEAFINFIIPEDFIYSKIEISNSNKFQEQITKLNKENIERWISFKEKIEIILPKIPGIEFNVETNRNIIGQILEIEQIRNEIIHLKSKDSNSNIHYRKVFEFLASKDLNLYLAATKKFINILQKDYIKIENYKDNYTSQEIHIKKVEHLHIGIYFEIIKVKEKRITIFIEKWENLTKESEHLKTVFSYLKLMEDMNLIVDYLITEDLNYFKLEIFKNDEQIK
ncbi:hypothetical protein [Flavobacterium sp. KBS0721]|uniref:hypothetical protein n=1 Tax=Flavobacterium sp. KBS0721 TaxID=1179672 RepID=UPI00098FCE84|nr:hypothetical protein [Flavobacterium sp. KBS0721]QDW20587.1 hypothetical protein B0M43_0010880 [Flavobacterium sp. KBS0721]